MSDIRDEFQITSLTGLTYAVGLGTETATVVKFQSFGVMDMDEASNFIEIQKDKPFGRTGEWVQYGIENRMTHKLIGDCAIRLGHSDTGIAEIGITISHLEQRKGFAKEAMLSILKFLFEEKNIF